MSIPSYTVDGDIDHPWWETDYAGVAVSHRASLLRKNNDFYSNFSKTIPKEWQESGYVWACNIEDKYLDKILRKKKVLPSQICAPVMK